MNLKGTNVAPPCYDLRQSSMVAHIQLTNVYKKMQKCGGQKQISQCFFICAPAYRMFKLTSSLSNAFILEQRPQLLNNVSMTITNKLFLDHHLCTKRGKNSDCLTNLRQTNLMIIFLKDPESNHLKNLTQIQPHS